MLRLRLTHSILVLGALGAASGCARDLELEPAANPADVVIAQFDPTNAVPVLQLLPSPTALAQKPPTAEDPNTDALLDLKQVAPAPCEYPTTQQCLQYTKGWPTSALPTYYFVGVPNAEGKLLDESTIQAGLKLYKAGAQGLSEVAYVAEVSPIPAPPAACQAGGNGSDPPRPYTANEVPQGVQVVMRTALEPATNYFVVVTSNAAGGLRDINNKPVEQARLYSLLNVSSDNAPITPDGTITNALLRSNVQSTILFQRFEGREFKALTADEQAMFQTFYQASALRLVGLYTFFDRTATALETAGVLEDRKDAILMNTWKTGPAGAATTIAFDPANQKIPFPNTQLLTVPDPTAMDANKLKVALPPSATDSPTAAALKMGLNTLDGFSTTAPMVITATRDLDTTNLSEHIIMYPVSPTGAPEVTNRVPLTIATDASTASTAFTITIRPTRPLPENQNYVVAVMGTVGTSVLKDVNGRPVEAENAFNFLKIPTALISNNDIATVPEALLRPLQCSTVPTTGMIASDDVVKATATALETQLQHPRWLEAFGQMTMASLDPRQALMAWNYKTQTISSPIAAVRTGLLPLWESGAAGQRVTFTGLEYTGTASIAELAQVAQQLCLGICRSGEMTGILPADCADAQGRATPAVRAHPFCGLATNIVAGELESARLYVLRSFRATTGNPYVAGTFTPQTVMQPAVAQIPFWVIRGRGAAPAAGYPVAIFQHGLGSRKEAGFYLANMMARANGTGGWATVVMDMPFHGSRASDLSRSVGGNEVPCVDAATMRPNIDPGVVRCTTNPATGLTTCTDGCDGVQDASGTGFLSTNVFSARDNFRQATIDQLVLLNAIQEESGTGGALEFLDGDRVGYIGQSLGAIAGGNLAGYVSPDEIDATVLNVGGGSLTTILVNAIPQISAPLFVALNAAGVCEYNIPGNPTGGCKSTPTFRQFLLTAQWALDPGDPLGNSINVVKAGGFGVDNVLMQMSRPDPVVTNLATYALAYSGYGIAPGDPRLQIYDFSNLPAATVGSGCHSWLLAPVCGQCLVKTLCATLGAQYQAAQFLESDAQTTTSTVPTAQFAAGFDCNAPCN